MNKIILIGRLTKDAELKYSPNGNGVTRGSIAVNNGYGDKQKTDFFDFTSFGKQAENVASLCKKGSQVCIEGKATFSEYEKDGKKQKNFQIILDSFVLLEKKKESFIDDDLGF